MFSRHLPLSLACALCILAPSPLAAQQPAGRSADPASVVLARRLLQAMHQGENLLAGVESVLTEQRRHDTQVPAVFYDSLLVPMKRTVSEVLDSLAPGYAWRFTAAELEAMVHFFESPAGQNLANQQAGLSVEAMQLGQRWGARLAASVMKDLVVAGIDITKP